MCAIGGGAVASFLAVGDPVSVASGAIAPFPSSRWALLRASRWRCSRRSGAPSCSWCGRYLGALGGRRSWAGQLSRKGAPNGSDSDVKASWAPERVRGFRAA